MQHILDGLKTVEVRVAYRIIARLQPGDRLLLNRRYLCRIEQVRRYASFEDLLASEDLAAIAPDLLPEALLPVLRELYPAEKEALGVVALHIAPERKSEEQ